MARKVPDEVCVLHGKKVPCLSCRAAKAGRARSEKKTQANRARARIAALTRWGRKQGYLPDEDE